MLYPAELRALIFNSLQTARTRLEAAGSLIALKPSLPQSMERFAEFLRKREYLLNVSPAALTYYQSAFNAWKKHGDAGDPKNWIINMRNAGISPVSCNTYISRSTRCATT
jgi:hypothetical protein